MGLSINYKAKGVVFDIQRFSLNDGPGIRTIVFLKGCPLSCRWCSNPESQETKPTLMYDERSCIHCGKCIDTCKQGALSEDIPGFVNRDKCIGCGECADVCPAGALTLKGKETTVEAVIRELKKDSITYSTSNGGVTFSGGEPLVQWQFLTELLKASKAQGWHTAIETSGFGSSEAVESVFPYIDQVLLDCKSTDDEVHKANTGVTAELIRKNAMRISEIAHTIIRVPTIPGVNASEEDFENICKYAKTLHGVDTIHILPYHTMGLNKYKMMGTEYTISDEIQPLEDSDVLPYKEIVEKNGFKCKIGG